MSRPEELTKPDSIAGRMLSDYFRIRDNAFNSVSIEEQFKALLGISVSEQIDLPAISRAVAEVQSVMHDKQLLYSRAISFVMDMLEKRTDHLSGDEIKDVAAYMVAWSALQYAHFDGKIKQRYYIPSTQDLYEHYPLIPPYEREEATEIIDIDIPDLHYAGVPARHPLYDVEWRRGNKEYPRHGWRTAQEIVSARFSKGTSVKLLDIGFGDGWFLGEAERAYGHELLLHGVTMRNVFCPNAELHSTHLGPAEVLPTYWDSQMDVVFSNFAYLYFMLPHRALEEAVRVLAPGAEAHLHTTVLPSIPGPQFREVYESIRGLPSGAYTKYVRRHFEALQDKKKEAVVYAAAHKLGRRVETMSEANMLHIFRTA